MGYDHNHVAVGRCLPCCYLVTPTCTPNLVGWRSHHHHCGCCMSRLCYQHCCCCCYHNNMHTAPHSRANSAGLHQHHSRSPPASLVACRTAVASVPAPVLLLVVITVIVVVIAAPAVVIATPAVATPAPAPASLGAGRCCFNIIVLQQHMRQKTTCVSPPCVVVSCTSTRLRVSEACSLSTVRPSTNAKDVQQTVHVR
jgi:hypothetical protein